MNDRTSPRRLPPGPRGWPLVGHLAGFQRDPLMFLSRLTRQYGDVASFRIGRRLLVHVADPELIREILVVRHRSFLKTGYLNRARPVLGNGLVTADGEFHRRQRRLIQPAFTKQRVLDYADVVVRMAAETGDRWTDGSVVDVSAEMLDLTLRVIARTLFGVEAAADAPRIEAALTVVLEHFTRLLSPWGRLVSRLPMPSVMRFRRAKAQLDDFVETLIRERRASGEDHGDVLSMLLLAQDADGDNDRMSDQQVRDEVMTLLTAGHETIATAMTWTWYALAQHPAVLEQLCEEVDAVVGNRLPTAGDLPRLRYAEMVLAESMRLFPPIWGFTRLVQEEQELAGYVFPAGTVIGLSQFVVQRDERNFPDPERFDPERWTPEARAARPRYAYFPFGGGPRLCIGEPYAWLEGMLILATLCRSWRPEPTTATFPGFQPLITLRPRQTIRLKLHRRRTAQSPPEPGEYHAVKPAAAPSLP